MVPMVHDEYVLNSILQVLLGTFTSTNTPGEFVWMPGPLTKVIFDKYIRCISHILCYVQPLVCTLIVRHFSQDNS